jgi:lipopolysaccharide biosynthesis glycosyltransferase
LISINSGGDQGLLNSYFNDWSRSFSSSRLTARLPFTYNVTPTAFYSYTPAFVHYKNDIKAVHFVGAAKPWKFSRFNNGEVIPHGESNHEFMGLVAKWWSIFDEFGIAKSLVSFHLDRDWSIVIALNISTTIHQQAPRIQHHVLSIRMAQDLKDSQLRMMEHMNRL